MVAARLNDRRRWGIIYCPRIGAVNKIKKWREIRSYLVEKGVTYDYIQSENYGSVERLARMLVDNGYETIVVVGGDGAVQDALNGIMSSANRRNVTLGIVPNGIANDFASYWGISTSDYRKAVDCIIAGRRRNIDVGCCKYVAEDGEKVRYFVNALNIGLSARVVEIANKKVTAPFAKWLYYVRSFLLLLLHRNSHRVKMRLNNQTVDTELMMLCVGNARGYGLTPSAVPYNGYLDVSIVKKPMFFGLLQGMYMMYKRRIMNYELLVPFRTTAITIESVGVARCGLDGRPFTPTFPMDVTILKEELSLIIPK
ncbi:MAG: YegS/Rv2252/BmrU family lipid kinase [Bacteroidaceae bacterium]|nr:YegS/Rv2252/BmrU family lipid kinase [Bacteroidaceae bacterium]